VGGDEAGGGEGDERGKGVALHVGVEGREVVHAEIFGGVHGGLRRLVAGLMIRGGHRERRCVESAVGGGTGNDNGEIQGSLHCAAQVRAAAVEMTRVVIARGGAASVEMTESRGC
jgi:hypothetical protein